MKWSKEQIETIKLYLSQGESYQSIAHKLNVTYSSVEHAVRRYELSSYFVSKQALITQRDLSFEEQNKLLIRALSDKLKKAPKPIPTTPVFKKNGDTLVVQFTDWHIGRIVKDEYGNQIYNTDVFKKRVHKLLQEMLGLLDSYISKGTPITDVVVLATGDIMDGMGIYASQEVQSELSPPFQVMLGVKIIQQFILALVDRKLGVKFYGVRGNHGEIRSGGKSKDPNANWDMQLYLVLDFWVQSILKNKNVEVAYSELDYLNLVIRGWKYHIRHIAPQQSETSAGKAKFLGWARKHECDVLVYGHYHHYSITDRSGITVIRGGSVTGADEFSESLAEESEPIQLIWGCSKNRPMTFMYAIDLGIRKKK